MTDKKTVLVTGGAGFIGKHTVNALNAEGFDVIVADRNGGVHYEKIVKY